MKTELELLTREKRNAFECYFYLGWAAQSPDGENKATVESPADLWTSLPKNIMLL